MKQLREGQIYAVGGGFFEAKRDPETGQWQLWTHEGLGGHVIGRIGFDVGDDGRLYDRVFDFEAEEVVVWPESSYCVDDLVVDYELNLGLARIINRQRVVRSATLNREVYTSVTSRMW